jgi:hypothetical protein
MREGSSHILVLDGAELWSALERNEDIKVFHTSDDGIDHHWTLSKDGKENLRKRRAQGLI